ncbi:hypothetical protein ACQ4PT_033595 [Festuca glaucescens]
MASSTLASPGEASEDARDGAAMLAPSGVGSDAHAPLDLPGAMRTGSLTSLVASAGQQPRPSSPAPTAASAGQQLRATSAQLQRPTAQPAAAHHAGQQPSSPATPAPTAGARAQLPMTPSMQPPAAGPSLSQPGPATPLVAAPTGVGGSSSPPQGAAALAVGPGGSTSICPPSGAAIGTGATLEGGLPCPFLPLRAPPPCARACRLRRVVVRATELPQMVLRPRMKTPWLRRCAAVQNLKWTSKNRFAAKRLCPIAVGLTPEKRAVIGENSAFRVLLNISPFIIPNELIDYIMRHTTSELREFRVGKKRIVFTADMITKVFGICSGSRHVVLLKRSEQHAMCDVYRGTSTRSDIPTAIKVLTECLDTDQDTVIRSWDLLCMATVIDPSSSNHLCMEYLGSMLEPTRTHEYAWDEYILDLAMKKVSKIQKKRDKPLVLEARSSKFEFWISGPFAILCTVYMDHLHFPPNDHVIDYSLPRVCNVTSDDFVFVVSNDLNNLILNNKTVHERRPVPARFKHLHDKHKALFASDFDVAIKKIAAGVKRMQSQRMSTLLNDVDAALKEADGPSIVFSSGAATHAGGNTNADFASEQQGAATEGEVPEAEGEEDEVLLDESEDNDTDEDAEEEDGSEEDEPMCAAKEPGVHSHNVALDVPQSVVMTDSSCLGGNIGEQQIVDSPARSPFAFDEVRCASWNMAPDAPTMDLFEQGTADYNFFVGNIPDPPSRTSNGADIATLSADVPSAQKPHAAVCESATCDFVFDKDVAIAELVWVEKFNREAKIIAQKNPRLKKKYAFTQFIVDKLIVDLAAFDLHSCMKELKLVSSKFKILKDDLFANFNMLVIATNLATFNLNDFVLTNPDHQQQTTLFDCGFFSHLFMDSFDAKVMAHFDNNAILDHWKAVAASLIDARDNGDVVVEAIMDEELIKKK